MRKLLILLLLSSAGRSFASPGTEGAAFLDIPVGGGPAAMGSAYSALAADAYAATINPAGLGFVDSTQLSGQHLAYLDTIHYEYLSFAHPFDRTPSCSSLLCGPSGIGMSVQYLGSGNIPGFDVDTNGSPIPTGNFSAHYAAYNLAYGKALTDRLAVGVTGKIINATLDDVSANAYAADLGSMYKLQRNLTLAATLTNMGTKLKFLSEGDSLPAAAHLAAAYQPTLHWIITTEGVYELNGLPSIHFGGEWHPIEMIALRAGYRTDTLKSLSVLAGFTTGLGIQAWGHELAYAWVPMGDLGNTHYFSLLMKFGEAERARRNLIKYQTIKQHRTASGEKDEEGAPEYQQLMELLNDTEQHNAKANANNAHELR